MRFEPNSNLKNRLAVFDSFRLAFLFGLTFMGGLYFSHRYHEADRRIDERRLLLESSERVFLEVERRIQAKVESVRAAGISLAGIEENQTAGIRLPSDVESVWVGRWKPGAERPEWLGASSKLGFVLHQGPGLTPEQLAPLRSIEQFAPWRDRVARPEIWLLPDPQGEVPDFKRALWFTFPEAGERPESAPLWVLARVSPEFLLLADQDMLAHRDAMSRMEIRLVTAGNRLPAGTANQGMPADRRVRKALGVAPFLILEAALRGDAVWRTRLELEKNGLWLLLGALLIFYITELLLTRLRPAGDPADNPSGGTGGEIEGDWLEEASRFQRGSRFPSRATSGLNQAPRTGARERTVTREIKAGAEVFGGMSETVRTKIERKEVAVLHGRLVEPDLWTAEGMISPQEVADSVFEILGGVREALQSEGLQPEVRLFEEGAFTIFFEVWGEGQGGFAAPLKAILAIRKVVARINGLRNTDGHRSVRIMMGLRTGVLVRDARALPVRYHGITLREAQDLSRAAGLLGVDCLIAPMGDESRGDPLLQLAGDFILKPSGHGVFPADSAEKRVSLYVVEGTRDRDEQGVAHESPVVSGATFAQVPEAGAKTAARELKLEYLQVAALEAAPDNVIPLRQTLNPEAGPVQETSDISAAIPETPARKSEAS